MGAATLRLWGAQGCDPSETCPQFREWDCQAEETVVFPRAQFCDVTLDIVPDYPKVCLFSLNTLLHKCALLRVC